MIYVDGTYWKLFIKSNIFTKVSFTALLARTVNFVRKQATVISDRFL